MDLEMQVGMCSDKNREVTFQFKKMGRAYYAVGSFLSHGGMDTSADGSSELSGPFYTSSDFVCRRCGRNHRIYQCCHCLTFICYDGNARSNAVCPRCGQVSDIPASDIQGTIMRSSAAAVKPDILLVLDTSGSMNDLNRLEEVKAAAINNFVNVYEGKCRMGLVTFGASARVVLPLTEDAGRMRRALRSLAASGGTVSPFRCIREDALLEPFRSSPNPRYIVVFTDGEWSGKDENNRSSARRLKDMGIVIIPLGCADANFDFLSDIGNGEVIQVKEGEFSGGIADSAKKIFGNQ